MNDMKLLMDADCLIKLTKAGLKETVCRHCSVLIPLVVKKEVVDEGKKKGCADAFAVEENIAAERVSVITDKNKAYANGDHAVFGMFKPQRYDAIATDDAKLIRHLKSLGIPYLLPGLILYWLNQQGLMDKSASLRGLERLAPFISEDEYSTVHLLMGEIK